jgi:hypothetical protein
MNAKHRNLILPECSLGNDGSSSFNATPQQRESENGWYAGWTDLLKWHTAIYSDGLAY